MHMNFNKFIELITIKMKFEEKTKIVFWGSISMKSSLDQMNICNAENKITNMLEVFKRKMYWFTLFEEKKLPETF